MFADKFREEAICRWILFGVTLALCRSDGAESLRIVIMEGDGAINNIRLQRAKEPIIMVETESGEPVAGAIVHFSAPTEGPGATFINGSSTSMAVTESDGLATTHGLRPNKVVGQFQIRVTASYAGSTASGTITQTNAEPAAGGWNSSKKILILAIVGGAVAGGAALAAKGGSGVKNGAVPAPSGTVIMPGAPAFGAP